MRNLTSLFIIEKQQIFYRMQDKDPAILKPATLLDYHRKTHMLYTGATKRNPPNKVFVNSIVTLHDRIVKEMLKRNFKHTTPLKKI